MAVHDRLAGVADWLVHVLPGSHDLVREINRSYREPQWKAAGRRLRPAAGRGRAEGAEELVAEGVHWLERSFGTRQQPVLPAPGGNLPEHGRDAGDDRDHHLVAGPGAGDRR